MYFMCTIMKYFLNVRMRERETGKMEKVKVYAYIYEIYTIFLDFYQDSYTSVCLYYVHSSCFLLTSNMFENGERPDKKQLITNKRKVEW